MSPQQYAKSKGKTMRQWDDTVIGAGSIVTRDIPSGVVAVGNPCRVLRKITDADRTGYGAL